jgi:Dolichyl-phosphate-mannose-protein mannosyltransferase
VIVSIDSTSTASPQTVKFNGGWLSLEEWQGHSPERLSPYVFYAVAVIFVGARLWRLTSYGLFGDEVFTLWTAAQDWRSLFASVVGDVVHPPLFYVILKLWIGIGGQSIFWLKLLPALFSIASILPFFQLCRALRLRAPAMTLALWLIAVNGFLINHSQELRMYGLLLLLVLTSLWLFATLVNQDCYTSRTQVLLCVVNLCLVFTHYYGWVVVTIELFFLLIWKRQRLRSFAIGAAFVALCFSPWVWVVAKAARVNPSRVNFVWNRPPAASELVGFYGNLNGPLSYQWKVFGTALVLLVFLGPVILWGWRILRREHENNPDAVTFWWLVLFAFGPVALSFVASHLLPQPVWAFRYLIIAAPAYMLLVAASAYRLPGRRVRFGALVLLVCWSGLSGFVETANRGKISWEPLVQQMIQAEPDQGAVKLYVADANIGNTIQFYLDQANDDRFKVTYIGSLTSQTDEHYWVALIRYANEVEPLPQSILRERGYSVGETIEAEAAGQKAMIFPVWRRR